ncbi:TAF6-like RNA polymerase II p300/CBP-associated factor-associated factor 65 kDa subunit 6L isoform X1 [Hemiscyllium ocellatum]|uniref:TAF6-like RNA polymerase II p300/CBP-associated factor-associated factor 65 kDa subunit 6L isoform X1 n=1 Tax=Hemiscyllium ocellatum TaxID=170820 RepID=UPI0029663724|nr:TAF6-like RNA polymerase II p300/CBP-associated factor-associated factor 65 kDa subunit 6L isoform X1 [Hemiscyllium ocellatum]
MSERDERRYVELSKESVKLMGESVGLELGDEVSALLAEDVCYRLRETAQNSTQFMRHAKRRRLTVEDFNRALRWANVEPVCGYGASDMLPFRSVKDGELFVMEDREVNLVELALATNIPKGCGQTVVRVQVSYLENKATEESQGAVPVAVSSLSDDLLKYYQQITRAVLGDDQQLMKVALQDLQSNSKIAALLPYFVHVVSGVKSVSHDLDQLNRLLHIVKSLIGNPYLYLGNYIKSLVSSVMYCILEPLAASINPLNDHWTLRDYAALLLTHIFRCHGDLVSSLYHQILLTLQKVLIDPVRPLCSHYGALVGLHALGWKAVERVLYPHLHMYWPNLQAVLDDNSVSNAQVKADGHKVYGAILVAVENLLKTKLLMVVSLDGGSVPGSPAGSPVREPHTEFGFGITSHLLQTGTGLSYELVQPAPGLAQMYQELYSFFGDSLATRFGTGSMIPASALGSAGKEPVSQPASGGSDLKAHRPGLNGTDQARKMPQLTMSLVDSPVQGGSPGPDQTSLQRAGLTPRTKSTGRTATEQGLVHQRGSLGLHDVFQRAPVCPQAGPSTFLIAGRQMGRRGKGRVFQTSFPVYHRASLASKYSQRLPMIGRVNKPIRRWLRADYPLYLPL